MYSFFKRPLQTIAATIVVLLTATEAVASTTPDDLLFGNLTDFGYGIYLLETGFFKQANRRMSELIEKLEKQPVQKSSNLLPLLRTDTGCGDTHKLLSAEALEVRALSRFQLKQQTAALADLTKAISLCPEHAHLRITLGRIYLKMKRTKEGLSEIDRALSLNPALPDPYFAKASYFQNSGKRKEAQLFLTKGKTLAIARQKLLDSLSEKIVKLEEGKRTEEVLSADTELISAFPRDVYAITGYAQHLNASGKNQEALKYASVAVLLDPTYAGAYRARSKVYASLNKPDLELADATRAFIMEPRSLDTLNARALANLDADRPFEAIRDLDLLIQLNPDYADAYIYRCSALCRVGRFDDAIKDARKAYAIAPSSPYGYQSLGTALRGARRFSEARKALEESLRYKSSASPDSLAMAEFNLGATLKESGDESANQHLDEAVRLAPNLPLILLQRGTYDARKTAPDRGIRVLTRQVRIKTRASMLNQIGTEPSLTNGANKAVRLTRLSSLTNPASIHSEPPRPNRTNPVAKGTGKFDAKYQRLSVRDLLDCVVLCTRQIEQQPDRPNPYLIRGIASFCSGKFETARYDLNRYDQLLPASKCSSRTLAHLAKYLSQSSAGPHLTAPEPSELRDLIKRTADLVSAPEQLVITGPKSRN